MDFDRLDIIEDIRNIYIHFLPNYLQSIIKNRILKNKFLYIFRI